MEKEKTGLKQGGALAVGSLVAIFTAQKGRRRKDSEDKRSSCEQREDQPSQRQQFILQNFHGSKSCASNGSMEMVSADNLMPGEDPVSVVNSSLQSSENNDQEIALNSIEMCDNHCFAEEIQSPELNILPLDELDKDAKNDEDTIEIAEEDEMDAVKISTEEITAVKSDIEEDDNNKEEKIQVKGSSILEENSEVAEKDEQTAIEICAEKEDDRNNFEKESPLKEMIEVKQGEAIDKVEEQDAIDAAKINDDGNGKEAIKEAKEKLLLEEMIEVEEEKPIGVESCEEKTAFNIIEKEDGDDKKGFPLMKDIEVKQEATDVVAEDYVMQENLSTNAIKGNDEEAEKRHSLDEKEESNYDFNRNKNKSRETESSSKESVADEICTEATVNEALQDHPNNIIKTRLSKAKTTESDEGIKTKDFDHFISSKNDNIDSSTSINQRRGNFTFSRKEENLRNKRPEMNLRKWKIPVEHVLIQASMVLLFLIAMHFCFYLLCNNIVIR